MINSRKEKNTKSKRQVKPGEMDKAYPLIQTKLLIPPRRPDLVHRTHLIEKLNKGTKRKLTLISAPAGFGKTTLLSEWISESKIPVAWISLDRGDNDPVQFTHYLVSALQNVDRRIGEAALTMLQSPQQPPIESIMTNLISDIADISNRCAIVLDDYHTIDTEPIHKVVGSMLDYLPARIHLVISTRVDPPLPLARLRSRDQMAELRATDLSFNHDETSEFLHKTMNIGLTTDEISILESRTEGWIAGLQLAALSMQTQQDIPSFIRTFAGDDRHIVDYLAEEVLDSQPDRIRKFLLQTSIVDRLSGPLCDFVTDQKDSQKHLEDLDRANMFIVALDNKRQWYRYHQLFADVLLARLQQSRSEMITSLHMRASDWFHQNDQIAEAVNHALAAGNYNRAAYLIEQNALALLLRGEFHILLRWIKELPEEVTRQRPWLCIYQAWALAFAGRVDRIAPLLKYAEQIVHLSGITAETGIDEGERQNIIGNIVTIRAFVAVVTGDFNGAIKLSTLAGKTLPESSIWTRSVQQWALGISNRYHGDLTIAEQSCIEVVRLGREIDNIWTIVTGLTDLAMVYQTRGQLHEAKTLYYEALESIAKRGIDKLGYTGRVEAGLAHVMYEQNDLKSALHFAKSSVEKTHYWNNPIHFVFSYVALARVHMAQRDFKGTSDAIAKADHTKRKLPIVPALSGMLEKSRIHLWLAQDKKSQIGCWAKENAINDAFKSTVYAKIPDEKKPLLITLARVYIAQAKIDEALKLLRHLEGSPNTGGGKNQHFNRNSRPQGPGLKRPKEKDNRARSDGKVPYPCRAGGIYPCFCGRRPAHSSFAGETP